MVVFEELDDDTSCRATASAPLASYRRGSSAGTEAAGATASWSVSAGYHGNRQDGRPSVSAVVCADMATTLRDRRQPGVLGTIGSWFARRGVADQMPVIAAAGGQSLETIALISKDKYKRNQTLRDALENRDTILIKGSWLLERWNGGKWNNGAFGLPKRQEVERQQLNAIWKVDELFDLCSQGRANIVGVSHCWLGEFHPDPRGENMTTICKAIDMMLSSTPLEDLALFIDWCSLYQEPRSEVQEQSYARASAQSYLWFLHQNTRVWLLTKVPEHVERPEAYEQRGWPCLERALADMLTQTSFMLDLGKMNSTCLTWGHLMKACAHERQPPVAPEVFKQKLKAVKFASTEDLTLAAHRYEKGFLEAIAVSTTLSFSDLRWGDLEAAAVAKMLPQCGLLEKLVLNNNNISETGLQVLVNAVMRCPSLTELWVARNPVGRAPKIEREKLIDIWVKAGRDRDHLHL